MTAGHKDLFIFKNASEVCKIKKFINKEAIKTKALELFEKNGVSTTSVNDIVKSVGIAKGTFYLYFNNKDELINEIFEVYNESFSNDVIFRNNEAPKIKALAQSILDYFSHRKMFLIELRNNLNSEKEYQYINNTVERFLSIILNFLRLEEASNISAVEVYAKSIMIMIIELCYQSIIEKNIDTVEEAKYILEDVMKRFFKCE